MVGPKIAVIIPCYNSERFIRQTLDSVLSQNYDSFQVVVVNDGSTDNTSAILKTYGKCITVLGMKGGGNYGQFAALNLGISRSKSDYVAFMDHDDLWQPGKLKMQVDILDRYQEIGLVYTNGQVVDEEDRVLYTLFGNAHIEKNDIGDILLDCYIRTPSMVMVRRSLLELVGPFKEGIIADQDMWVRIKEVSMFFYLNELLLCYREHQGQFSSSHNRKMWKDALLVLQSATQRYQYPRRVIKSRSAVIHYRLGKACLRTHAYPAAILHLMLSFWHDPFRAVLHVAGRR